MHKNQTRKQNTAHIMISKSSRNTKKLKRTSSHQSGADNENRKKHKSIGKPAETTTTQRLGCHPFGGNGAPAMFLVKTYDMLSKCDESLAAWADDGETFVVKDQDAFAANVIPNYFEHSNFSSFARQLNFYGFKKMHPIQMDESGRERHRSKQVRFHHSNFKRGRKDLLSNIFRSTRKKNTAGSSNSSSGGGSGSSTDKNSADNNKSNKSELETLKAKFSFLETKMGRMEESIEIIKHQVREMAALQRLAHARTVEYHQNRYPYGGQNMNMPQQAQSMPNHMAPWPKPHHGLVSFSNETLDSEPLPYKTNHHQIGQNKVPMEVTAKTTNKHIAPSWPESNSSLVSASPVATLEPSPHVKEIDPALLPPPPPPPIASTSFLRGFSDDFPESDLHTFPDWTQDSAV